MKGLIALIEAVEKIPNTFWGITILYSSMYMSVKYNAEIGYYFAGVGSTLLGITPVRNTVATLTTNPNSVKVETNASDPTSKD